MIYSPTLAEMERRETLIRLCADALAQAAIVRDEGRELSARQRDELGLLISACRWVRDGLRQEART
jgi:hypothetical protein